MAENLEAWGRARELAVLSLRLTTKAVFQKHPELANQIQETAIAVPGILSRRQMPPTDAEELWLDFTFGEAGVELHRLKTLLYIANDLGLITPEEGPRLLEAVESTHRLIVGLQRAQNKGPADAGRARPIKPSGSPGPSRRPPASGGGSRGDAPWDNRS